MQMAADAVLLCFARSLYGNQRPCKKDFSPSFAFVPCVLLYMLFVVFVLGFDEMLNHIHDRRVQRIDPHHAGTVRKQHTHAHIKHTAKTHTKYNEKVLTC